ncbi:hypothetical protein AXF42_Ash015159 [Apostasia shenzhenica]|uniref:Uncharacterized protein n=1 Tax=Apostasia shenzhenica TaxID=1088818 RepID=A0A2I0AQF5_9ASPA|nr:hypothetical protein AXF42_Ash015159 [Apostasia shenzhenica]
MCVDFTDLNKACPKDFYPLSKIDRLVDCSAGYSVLNDEFRQCFLRLPSDPNGRKRRRTHFIYYRPGDLLLQSDAFRFEKCKSDLSAHD